MAPPPSSCTVARGGTTGSSPARTPICGTKVVRRVPHCTMFLLDADVRKIVGDRLINFLERLSTSPLAKRLEENPPDGQSGAFGVGVG